MLVRNMVDGRSLVAVARVDAAPDLAQLRDRYPGLSRLWDAVRHEFWAQFSSPREHFPHPTRPSERQSVTSERVSTRVELVTRRAARAGYHLVHGSDATYAWVLLDAEDEIPLHSAATLDQIDKWLSE